MHGQQNIKYWEEHAVNFITDYGVLCEAAEYDIEEREDLCISKWGDPQGACHTSCIR